MASARPARFQNQLFILIFSINQTYQALQRTALGPFFAQSWYLYHASLVPPSLGAFHGFQVLPLSKEILKLKW